MNRLPTNLVSALTQLAMTLIVSFIALVSFSLLDPTEMAGFRQHYFLPVLLVNSVSGASLDYLRSVIFGGTRSRHGNAIGVILVHAGATACLIIVIGVLLLLEGGSASAVMILAVVATSMSLSLRLLSQAGLEQEGRYPTAVLVNNTATLLPYVGLLLYWYGDSLYFFFGAVIVLNAAYTGALAVTTLGHDTWRRLNEGGGRVSLGKYFALAAVSVGSIAILQGSEFLFYTATDYSKAEIAGYALAFTAAAVLRQVVTVSVQPLQRLRTEGRHASNSALGPTALEGTIYALLTVAAIVGPQVASKFFPKYEGTSEFLPILILGVLGSACQQVHAVRLVVQSRVRFLGVSQIVVFVASAASIVFLSSMLNLRQMVLLLTGFIWLRGVVAIPIYASYQGIKSSAPALVIRALASAILLGLSIGKGF